MAAASPCFAGEPPTNDVSATVDRGAEVLNRLRHRDPAAALQKEASRWRKAGSPGAVRRTADGTTPELLSHEPARLRDDAPAVSMIRQQEEADAEPSVQQPSGEQSPGGLNLNDLGLDDLGLDDLGLPDDLNLDFNTGNEDERAPSPSSVGRTIRDVRDLTAIRSILPFGAYDPNPDPNDPCRNLCPRPEGCPPGAEAGEGRASTRCPEVTPLSTDLYRHRPVVPVTFRWAAPNSTYNPLYFQDVNLERYGHHHGVLQPAASVAKFGTQLIGLPYQMALDPPCKCETPLGYYRPGDCAPKLHYQIPLNAKAALVQAAAVSGVALILP
ncbi:hypothetical protein LzC2_14990 [Planctomycetes bacterium LzC2]|uniref:Uncharacterized protein n=1 Tax=Alienimonas chondri TaxID=2681879 RepID=A0ABX1VCJ2_9PLAN|nr:hypothetical protein [Alienimonas chondri]